MMESSLAVPTPYGCIGCKLLKPDYPPAVITFIFCLMVITIVIDLVGNPMVIWAVTKNKKLRNSGNIFVASLSVVDMLVAIYPYPLMLHAMAIGGWDLSQFQCQVVGFMTGLSVVGSIFNIMAIAINRYCYICHSLQYERIFSMRNTFIYLIVTWIMSFVAVLPNMYIGTIEYDPRTYTCIFSYVNNPSFAVTIVCVHFVLPLLIVGFCYVRIWIKVLAARNQTRPNPENQLAEVRNFLTMFVIFLLFAMCWCPINVLTVLVAVGPKYIAGKIPNWVYLAVYFIAFFNSCLNAVIYGLLNENFRREYWAFFYALRHPILFFSGFNTDAYDSWEAQALAHARTRDQSREDCTSTFSMEEIPMNVWNVPLSSAVVTNQPGRRAFGSSKPASGLSRPPCACCKSVSGFHNKPVLSHSKSSLLFKPILNRYISSAIHSKGNTIPTTTRPEPTGGRVSPDTGVPKPTADDDSELPTTTSHLEPVTTGHPETAAGPPELGASCQPETTVTSHLEHDVPVVPEPVFSPATVPPIIVTSLATGPQEPAATTDPLGVTVLSTDTSDDSQEAVVIDVEVDFDDVSV